MAEQAAAPEQDKTVRQRSPKYPFIGLEYAIQRAKAFYEKEKKNAAYAKVAIKHWGYKEKSSGGIQTIAALKSYGLIQDSGSGDNRKLQLTPLAIRILLDQRQVSPEREQAIKEAALAPAIHRKAWQLWGTSLPSRDQLEHTLRNDWEFTESAIDTFIKEYTDTITYAKLVDSDNVPDSGEEEQQEPSRYEVEGMNQPPHPQQPTGLRPLGGLPPLPIKGDPHAKPVGSGIPVTKNCVMSITASGEVTQKGIDQLVAYLNLIKGSFPDDEQTS